MSYYKKLGRPAGVSGINKSLLMHQYTYHFMYINSSFRGFFCMLFIAVLFFSCSPLRGYRATVTGNGAYHSTYDDTTLSIDNHSLLMPYNRFIDPAGTVIRFGDPALENHSLDCILLPGGTVLAVEDRYGLAFINVESKKLLYHLGYEGAYKGLMSTYSGLKFLDDGNGIRLFWGAANPVTKTSFVVEANWNGTRAGITAAIPFSAVLPAPMSLPNDIAIRKEGSEDYLYVVLNGNSQLVKLRLRDKYIIWTTPTGMAPFGIALTLSKAYVTNWAGTVPADSARETAGIPYARVSVDARTGATASGSVSVIDLQTGTLQKEITVGLHPNAIIASPDLRFMYVANGNSDDVSVISTASDEPIGTIPVKLAGASSRLAGDAPNALALDKSGATLYVANGMTNAVVVVHLGSDYAAAGKGKTDIKGFIPTEAYPSGLAVTEQSIYVANLEGEGARTPVNKNFSIHQQAATISIIPVPDAALLRSYTARVQEANLLFRMGLSGRLPRKGIAPKPVPDRIGEPSLFKHVVYIIKENKTYDQVLGDMSEGNGNRSLCIFGREITPNQHKLAQEYALLDNYYVSGKSSAEGHPWADAAIVTDYVEKNVRAWFRSYPHVLADALVYSREGFIWNNALDHGKTVRIYGEACTPVLKTPMGWKEIYQYQKDGKEIPFTNQSTISRLRPLLSPAYPGYAEQRFTDQVRADAFISELKAFEQLPGDALPQLMVLALPADHTAGMREGFPTPRAMVADNDLALGRIVQALTHSRFWDSTVIFVTEDDSQSGWDHVSAYRTTGFVLSPYSHLNTTVHRNYNQTCMVRTIEQILGIPPMNIMDATALPMFDCFNGTADRRGYTCIKSNIPLDEMNKPATALTGKAKAFALLSASPQLDGIDTGNDDLLNRIIWFTAMAEKKYPKKMTLPKRERKDDD